MTPYYSQDGITLYCGDCREILPQIETESIVTDPVWPNCEHVFPGVDAFALLNEALCAAEWCLRAAIHLGVNSDPRFLLAVPARLRFLRACYLQFIPVGYIGRILRDADVAYVFGEPPASKEGARVLPGCITAVNSAKDGDRRGWRRNRNSHILADRVALLAHPSQRKLTHVQWLVKWFAGASVCDPFCGSGTTLVAAQRLGIRAVGIEIEERYCELAAKRLCQPSLLPAMAAGGDL